MENPIDDSYRMDTCGSTGFDPPTTRNCEKFLKNSGVKREKIPEFVDGIHYWTVPETLQYRIEICGAAGGSARNVEGIKNWGGCVHSLVDLDAYQVLTVSLGQRGDPPCQKDPTNPSCLKISGSGGGGASMILHKDILILVAGGGGGLFGEKKQIDDSAEFLADISIGGRTHSNESWTRLKAEAQISRNPFENSIIMSKDTAGFGSSYKPGLIIKMAPNCSKCSIVNGNDKTASGGMCLDPRNEARGGFGGGGAACGKAAGGGGGFLGGPPGFEGPGWGGSSWSNSDAVSQAIYRAATNNGDGRFAIYPCKLKCHETAKCIFLTPVDQKTKCVCPDGTFVDENDHCQAEKSFFFLKIPFLLVFLCFLLSIGYLSYYLMKRRMQKAQRQKNANHEMEARIRADVISEFQRQHNEGDNEMRLLLEQMDDLPQIERNHIILLEPLGVGAFGEVFKATMRNGENTMEVAVKTLPFSSNKQVHDEFLMEAQIMNKFRHQNIVSLFGINFEMMPRYIVLEFMKGGDLKTYLRNSRATKIDPNPNNLLMSDLVLMCLDVAKGCQFLEANKFIHRDIAARNCLLTSHGPDRVVKIGDFGMARDVYRTDYYRKGGRALLPVKWMPPEALLDGYFTTKTDVWSFGILTWEVFSLGYMPYPGRNNMEVLDLISKGGRLEAPIGTPYQIYQIMLQCWKKKEETRPNFITIAHWLQKLAEDSIIRSQPIPDKNLSMPSTALQTPCVETPRSEITVTTGLNSPSPSREMADMREMFDKTEDFTCIVSSPYVAKNFAQTIAAKISNIQPILEERIAENGQEKAETGMPLSSMSSRVEGYGEPLGVDSLHALGQPSSSRNFDDDWISMAQKEQPEPKLAFVVPSRRRRPNTLPTKPHNTFEPVNQENNAFEFS